MHRTFLAVGFIFGALGVIVGAFGAHALKKMVPPETIASFETGVRYQFYHTLALCFTGLLHRRMPFVVTRLAGWCFILGILLFSGSIYMLTAFKATNTIGLNGIGVITPIGGVLLVLGWIFSLVAVIRYSTGGMKSY